MDIFFREEDLFYTGKNKSTKKYIYTLQNLYTHTINNEHIIYMQESSGQPHIDQYRSKLYSLYTSNDRLFTLNTIFPKNNECQQKLNATYI